MSTPIKSAILKLFPELAGGLHLDRYGRVVAISDPPEKGSMSERFRPRYAVDIEILTPSLEIDSNFPTYTAVPLPLSYGAGGEAGLYAFPEAGTIVVVGFAYGRQDHPIIRQIYPMGWTLPALEPKEFLIQQDDLVFQKLDKNGDWSRVTDGAILDDSVSRKVVAMESVSELGSEQKDIAEHSTTTVGSVLELSAGTVMTLLAGQKMEIASLGDLDGLASGDINLTTAKNFNWLASADKNETIQGNAVQDVGGSLAISVGKESTEKVIGAKTIEAQSILFKSATTISCVSTSGGGVSLFPELVAALDEIKAALDVLASHTHQSVGTISQGGTVSSHAAKVGGHRAKIGGITA